MNNEAIALLNKMRTEYVNYSKRHATNADEARKNMEYHQVQHNMWAKKVEEIDASIRTLRGQR